MGTFLFALLQPIASRSPETILSEPTNIVCICNKKLDLFGFIGPTVLKHLFNVTVVSQKLIKNGFIRHKNF